MSIVQRRGKMRKSVIFNIILIFLVLIAVCIVEDVVVTNSLREVSERCLSIEELVGARKDLRYMDIVMAVENLEYEWQINESKMCYMVNHKNIQEIGAEISKLKGYLDNNEFNDFESSLDAIKFYSHSYLHFMGASIHNIL
jgi:hypothetical protein